jgi:DNA primase
MGNKYAHDETVKYKLVCTISVDGVTSEADIVGALFGQTEGLLDQDMELKQLQKTGRIGRIQLSLSNNKGRTTGKIEVPSGLNKIESAIIAATLESVDRVGPCTCEIKLERIVDVRKDKRDQIAKRASEIMKQWELEQQSKRDDISEKVERDSRRGRVVTFGPDKLPAGPGIFKSREIILVEGRADVINLLKMDIDNTIALDGTKISGTIKSLCKNRTVTALLDGDRGGDMILKELALTTSVEYVARAPFMKEIEDLGIDDVNKALDERAHFDEAYFVTENMQIAEFLQKQGHKVPYRSKSRTTESTQDSRSLTSRDPRKGDREDRRPDRRKRDDRRDESSTDDRRGKDRRGDRRSRPRRSGDRDQRSGGRPDRRDSRDRPRREPTKIEVPKAILNMIKGIKQSMKAVFVNDKHETIVEVPTANVFDTLQKTEDVDSIIIDGVITQRLLDLSKEKKVKLIAGAVMGDLSNKPKENPVIATFNRI